MGSVSWVRDLWRRRSFLLYHDPHIRGRDGRRDGRDQKKERKKTQKVSTVQHIFIHTDGSIRGSIWWVSLKCNYKE